MSTQIKKQQNEKWLEIKTWAPDGEMKTLFVAYLENDSVEFYSSSSQYESEINELKEGIELEEEVYKPQDGEEFLEAISEFYKTSSMKGCSEIKESKELPGFINNKT